MTENVRVHYREGGYTTGQALAVLDIKAGRLRSLVEDGTLTETRTSGGQRRYDIEQVNALAAEWKALLETTAAVPKPQKAGPMTRMFAAAENHVCPVCGAQPGDPCTGHSMSGPGVHHARLMLAIPEGRVVQVDAPNKNSQREQETVEKVRQLYAAEDAAAVQRMEARTGGHVETPFEIAQKLIHDYFSLPKGMELAEETPLSLTAHELRGLLIEAAVQNGWSQARKRSHNLDVDCLTCGAAIGQTCNPDMQPDQLYAGWHRSRIESARERMYRGGDF